MKDRRMATPHYKSQADRDHLKAMTFTIILTWLVGAMAGASLALAFLT